MKCSGTSSIVKAKRISPLSAFAVLASGAFSCPAQFPLLPHQERVHNNAIAVDNEIVFHCLGGVFRRFRNFWFKKFRLCRFHRAQSKSDREMDAFIQANSATLTQPSVASSVLQGMPPKFVMRFIELLGPRCLEDEKQYFTCLFLKRWIKALTYGTNRNDVDVRSLLCQLRVPTTTKETEEQLKAKYTSAITPILRSLIGGARLSELEKQAMRCCCFHAGQRNDLLHAIVSEILTAAEVSTATQTALVKTTKKSLMSSLTERARNIINDRKRKSEILTAAEVSTATQTALVKTTKKSLMNSLTEGVRNIINDRKKKDRKVNKSLRGKKASAKPTYAINLKDLPSLSPTLAQKVVITDESLEPLVQLWSDGFPVEPAKVDCVVLPTLMESLECPGGSRPDAVLTRQRASNQDRQVEDQYSDPSLRQQTFRSKKVVAKSQLLHDNELGCLVCNTVVPQSDHPDFADLLQRCVVDCLDRASAAGCRSIAFSRMSLNDGREPEIVVATCLSWLHSHPQTTLEKIFFSVGVQDIRRYSALAMQAEAQSLVQHQIIATSESPSDAVSDAPLPADVEASIDADLRMLDLLTSGKVGNAW